MAQKSDPLYLWFSICVGCFSQIYHFLHFTQANNENWELVRRSSPALIGMFLLPFSLRNITFYVTPQTNLSSSTLQERKNKNRKKKNNEYIPCGLSKMIYISQMSINTFIENLFINIDVFFTALFSSYFFISFTLETQ